MADPVVSDPHQLQRFSLSAAAFSCIFVLIFFLFPAASFAQKVPEFEETSVYLNVSGLGGEELNVLIKDEQVYLSVTDLFEYLKIKNQISSDQSSVSGFFLNQNNTYVIDKTAGRIILQNETYILNADDLIQTLTGLYLKSIVFGKVFGLNCSFNFRSLSVDLKTKLDLPAIRERRLELIRSNIGKLNREIIADTTIGRQYPLFNFGAADWSVSSTQQDHGLQNTMLNIRLGGMLAGGETNATLNYNTQQSFKLNQQNYFWRYVNNDNKALRQVIAGNIPVQSIASLLAPVVGVQLTNSPTTVRRSFGTYTLADHTEPEWIVELYINNVLVDYLRADASGFFTFQVPMVYGSSALQLRFYGPGGEERTKEQNLSVPYNFLPKTEMEYTLSSGILEDGKQSRFSRVDLKYGLSRILTIGSGAEYLSSLSRESTMPFINASLRAAPTLFLSGDYTYGVRTRAIMNYRMPADLLFELDYIRYSQGQQAIYQNALEERKAILSKQFLKHDFAGFTRLSIDQVTYPQGKQMLADLLFSGTWQGVNCNLTTSSILMNQSYLNVYSNLSLSWRIDDGYTLRPQVQYGYTNSNINSFKFDLEKQVFGKGFLDLTFESNFNTHTRRFGLSLHFNLSSMRASFSAQQTNSGTTYTQSLGGGVIYDSKTNNLNFNNRNNVGRGGLIVYPYLDLNSNGRRDPGEPKIAGLNLKINGGRVQNNVRDTTVQIFDLEPYTSYLLELNPNSFDNIAWQLENAAIKVAIEPNKMKLIEIPVKVSAEVSGNVYRCNNDSTGQGRIIVNFYQGSKLVGHTITESDGYFSFLGLTSGSYTACVDPIQLDKLKMTAWPASKSFVIATTTQGTVVSNIEFKLQQLPTTKKGINKPQSGPQ
ncbi:MAG: Sporulation Domain-Containing Protein [Mucilaginibacter sp.]|nr:Sporulation Domain-Containing Protein [Mucilaginibacter sp.]